MSKEKISRNKEIYTKFRHNATYSDLAKEYGVSRTRINKILQHERSHRVKKDSIDIPEIKAACEYFDNEPGMYKRIVHALYERRLVKTNKWKRLSRPQILSIRNIGEKAADIIEYAQKIAR